MELQSVVLDSNSHVSGRQLLEANQIEVLPQFGRTCWFNAILMVMLYSQGLRNFIYEKALEWQSEEPEELEQNKFKRFLMYILKYNYTQPRKITELFEKRVKPNLLLLSYLEKYHPNDENPLNIKIVKKNLKEELKYGFTTIFISNIFQSLFKNYEDFLELFFREGELYIKGFPNETQHPKVLMLYHDAFIEINLINIKPTTIEHEGISDYRHEITFHGQRYKLDSCCFSNYNIDAIKIGHAICTLTYDNQGYVYNGWTTTSLKQEYKLSATEKITYRKDIRKACKLFQRDWKTELHAEEGTAGFCLPQKDCPGLLSLNVKDLCYDFSKKKDRKILIYVRDDVYDLQALNLQSLASAKPETLNYSSLSVGRLSDKYHQLKEKTINELLEIAVSKAIYNKKELIILLENLNKYKMLFFILCGRPLEDGIDDDNKKAILIALIELYLKESIFFTIKGLEDASKIMREISYEIEHKINIHNYSILFNSLLKNNKTPYKLHDKHENEDLKHYFFLNLLKAFIYNHYYFKLELYDDVSILNALKIKLENNPEYLQELEKVDTYLIPGNILYQLLPLIREKDLNPEVILGLTLEDLTTLDVKLPSTVETQPAMNVPSVKLESPSKEISMSLLESKKIEVIPQYGNTSWFNAILMALLYSQGLREFVYQKAYNWWLEEEDTQELKKNKFKRFMMYVLKYNYTQPAKISELFKKRVKPELLLLSYLEYYYSTDKDEITKLLEKLKSFDYEFHKTFINSLFENLFINYEDFVAIYYYQQELYVTTKKYTYSPNVLLLYHEDFYKNPHINSKDKLFKVPVHSGIEKYEEEISFNGQRYKLDCCLASFKNKKGSKETIVGLTYDKKPYLYHSKTHFVKYKKFKVNNQEETFSLKQIKYNCKLSLLDWKDDLHSTEEKPFYFTKYSCSLSREFDEFHEFYDFSRKIDKKLLIYVRDDFYYREQEELPFSLLSIHPERINYSSLSVGRLSDKFHQLENKSIEELLKIAELNADYKKEDLIELLQNLRDYSILFLILCKRRLEEGINDDDNKKAILIALIELYLKEHKILADKKIKLSVLSDKSPFIQQLKELMNPDFSINEYLILLNSLLRNNYNEQIELANYSDEDLKNIFFLNLLKAFIYNNYYFRLRFFKDKTILKNIEDLYKNYSKNDVANFKKATSFMLTDDMRVSLLHLIKQYNLDPHIILGLSLENLESIDEFFNQSSSLFRKKSGGGSKRRRLKSYKNKSKI